MARPAPKPRAQRATQTAHTEPAKEPAKEPEFQPPVQDLGHALFGHAPVVVVAIEQIRYRSRTLVPVDRGRHHPRDVIDATAVREICGPGRFKLKPLGSNGRPVLPAIEMDCPDENGGLDLVAPMPEELATPAGAPGGAPAASAVSVESAREKMLADLLTSQRAAVDADRAWFSSTINALIAARGASGSGPSSDVYTKFLEQERARLATENAELRARVERLQLSEARRSSGSDDSFLGPLVLGAAQRFGIVPGGELGNGARPRGAGAPPAPAPPAPAPPAPASDEGADEGADEGPGLGLPTVEAFKAYIASGGTVPAAEVRAVVALRKAGAVPDDLWALFSPIAEYYGVA